MRRRYKCTEQDLHTFVEVILLPGKRKDAQDVKYNKVWWYSAKHFWADTTLVSSLSSLGLDYLNLCQIFQTGEVILILVLRSVIIAENYCTQYFRAEARGLVKYLKGKCRSVSLPIYFLCSLPNILHELLCFWPIQSRDISLLSIVAKTLACFFNSHLKLLAEEILPETPSGFRLSRETTDMISAPVAKEILRTTHTSIPWFYRPRQSVW